MKEKIILIGGGGHCKACIDVIEQERRFQIAGIIERKDNIGKDRVLRYPVIGTDTDLTELRKRYRFALITVGQVDTPEVRIRLYNNIKTYNFSLPVITSPRAYVSVYAKVEEGTIIMHDAVVNADAHIGRNCIVNTKALVEHDACIADHCHIATGAVINGFCEIGKGVFIGSKATVLHSKSKNQVLAVGNYAIIAAGAIVHKEVEPYTTVAGVPARITNRHER